MVFFIHLIISKYIIFLPTFVFDIFPFYPSIISIVPYEVSSPYQPARRQSVSMALTVSPSKSFGFRRLGTQKKKGDSPYVRIQTVLGLNKFARVIGCIFFFDHHQACRSNATQLGFNCTITPFRGKYNCNGVFGIIQIQMQLAFPRYL